MMRTSKRFDQIIHYEDETAIHKVCSAILSFLPLNKERPIVIVCIGTDRSTGDSLGPLIGSFLQEARLQRFHLVGTLDEPVHALNLEEQMDNIYENFDQPLIIGIDACLGRMTSIGEIKVGDGPVKPGAGVNKQLPAVGDLHITGIVNVAGHMEFFVLQNTRLNLVMKLAQIISKAIIKADCIYEEQRKYEQLEWRMTFPSNNKKETG